MLRKIITKLFPNKIKSYLRSYLPRYRKWIKLQTLLSPYIEEVVCIDVGASYFPHVNWQIFRESQNTTWIAVEPNEKNLNYVKNWESASKILTYTSGLSQDGGVETLYVTNVDSGSSLLKPVITPSMRHRFTDLSYFFPLTEKKIQTSKLSDVLALVDEKPPLILKLDTQGTELSILKGAQPILEQMKVVGIEMESTMLAQPVMQGSGTFSEACDYLFSYGFELLSVNPIYPKSLINKNVNAKTYLNECDAFFMLRRDILANLSVSHRSTALALYVSYQHFEEALSILREDQELYSKLTHNGCDVKALIKVIYSKL